MKKISKLIFSLFVCFGVEQAIAQKDNVGIGTTKPDQSAALDINSSNKGLLMPRMSLQQRNSIQNPANGLMVFQTDFLSGFYYYDGSEWKTVGGNTNANSVAIDPFDWSFTGNSVSSTAFLGTTNNEPLRFQVNNTFSGIVSPAGSNAATMYGFNTGARIGVSGLANTAIGYASMGGEVLTTVTGSDNNAMGYNALSRITTGSGNVAVGSSALKNLTGGASNFGLGGSALRDLTNGNDNVAIGFSALVVANSGSSNSNIGIGAYALTSTQGGANIGIGAATGELKTGNGNIYIGHNAGRAGVATTENNTLYIANSNTATPLIYGDFGTAKYLAIGEVAVADRAAAATGGYRLLVKGGMMTEKIKVAVAGTTDWADYVFEPSYKLMSLDNVESFVKENKHLPNVPSADEMSKNGLDVLQTSAKLMEKIEELTLYMIEINKEIKALKKENQELKKSIK